MSTEQSHDELAGDASRPASTTSRTVEAKFVISEDEATLKLAKYLLRNCNLLNSSQRYVKRSLLATGRVLVDGKIETDPSRRIKPKENVLQILDATVLLYNKPCGIITALSDSSSACLGSTQPVSEYLKKYRGLHAVGRLDQHSCGLLLLTNDGHITRALIDPGRDIARRYKCVVLGKADSEKLKLQLTVGVQARCGHYHANLLSATPSIEIEYEHKACTDAGEICLRNDGPRYDPHYSHYRKGLVSSHLLELSEVVIEISEGKKREVRRILGYCGHPVLNLRREAYGAFELGTLKAGDIRAATKEEMDWLTQLTTSV